jgi:hypothetical protein
MSSLARICRCFPKIDATAHLPFGVAGSSRTAALDRRRASTRRGAVRTVRWAEARVEDGPSVAPVEVAGSDAGGMRDDDNFESAFVASFARASVDPVVRGGAGARGVRDGRRLVYVLSAISVGLPLVGLAFAFVAVAVALVDVIAQRRHARARSLVASIASAIAVVVAAVIVGITPSG